MKTNDVLATMTSIVEKRIELYKEDFYKYDTEIINDEQPHEFVWMVRTTGTHLMTPPCEKTDVEKWRHWYDTFKRSNTWFYYVKLKSDGSGEVTLSEKRCDEFAYRMTRIRERKTA